MQQKDPTMTTTRPYDNIRRIIANATDEQQSNLADRLAQHNLRPVTTPTSIANNTPGALIAQYLADNPEHGIQFTGNAGYAGNLRAQANAYLNEADDGRKVSLRRLDPRAPGGAGRVSTWEAIIR